MRAYFIAALIGFASFAFVAACDFKLGDDTQGEMGNLHFAYTGDGCFFGCSLDKSVLEEAAVSVSITEKSERVRGARLGDAHGGSATASASCWCSGAKDKEGSSGFRSIEANGACNKDETRSCTLLVTVATGHPGDSKLEILEDGKVIDRVDIHVRSASRMELSVRANGDAHEPAADGAFEVKQGAVLALAAKVLDDHDDPMITGAGGLHYEYADEKVVKHAPGGFLFVGNDEDMTAMAPGSASVTVSTGFVKETARFRVVP
jgi:hypothetical protein